MKLKQALILLIITLLSSFLSFAEEEQKFLAAVSPTTEQTTNQAGVKTEEPAATVQTKIKNIILLI